MRIGKMLALLLAVVLLLTGSVLTFVASADQVMDDYSIQPEKGSVIVDGEPDADWEKATSKPLDAYLECDASTMNTTYKVLKSTDGMHLYFWVEITTAETAAEGDYLRIAIGENHSWICEHNHLHCSDCAGSTNPTTFSDLYATIPLDQEGALHITDTYVTVQQRNTAVPYTHWKLPVDIHAFVKKTETGYLVEFDWARDCGLDDGEVVEILEKTNWGRDLPSPDQFTSVFNYTWSPNTKTESLKYDLQTHIGGKYNQVKDISSKLEYLYPESWGNLYLIDPPPEARKSTVKHMDGIVLDAVAEEAWNHVTAWTVDRQISGELTATVTAKALWSGNHLYFLVEVTDSAFDPANPGMVKMYFDEKNDSGNGLDTTNDYIVCLTPQEGAFNVTVSEAGSAGETVDLKGFGKFNDYGFTLELDYTLNTVSMLKDNMRLKFDISYYQETDAVSWSNYNTELIPSRWGALTVYDVEAYEPESTGNSTQQPDTTVAPADFSKEPGEQNTENSGSGNGSGCSSAIGAGGLILALCCVLGTAVLTKKHRSCL